MKKEWYSAKELAGMPGLPKSPQGVNLKARNNRWLTRKKEGVQGKAVEYHVDSLPSNVRELLTTWEQQPQYTLNTTPALVNQGDPFTIWVSAYHQLTAEERQDIVALIVRIGVTGLIELIQQVEPE